jgi:preprotein translocase subunit SecD
MSMTNTQKIIIAFLLGLSWVAIIVATTYRPELALPLAPVVNLIQMTLGGLGVLHVMDKKDPPTSV